MYCKEIKSKIHKKSYISTSPLNITIGSDMPITLLYLMLMSKIYVVNSDMKMTSRVVQTIRGIAKSLKLYITTPLSPSYTYECNIKWKIIQIFFEQNSSILFHPLVSYRVKLWSELPDLKYSKIWIIFRLILHS